MASYLDIAKIFSERLLRPQITVAIAVSAQSILAEDTATPNHTERYAWAAKATSSPGAEADRFLIGVLAANIGATIQQIRDATDEQI